MLLEPGMKQEQAVSLASNFDLPFGINGGR